MAEKKLVRITTDHELAWVLREVPSSRIVAVFGRDRYTLEQVREWVRARPDRYTLAPGSFEVTRYGSTDHATGPRTP